MTPCEFLPSECAGRFDMAKTAGAAQQAAIAIRMKAEKSGAGKGAGEKAPAKKAAGKKAPAKKAVAKKTPAKKAAGTFAAPKKAATKKAATTSMPKNGKDPKGGLTGAGRKFYNDKTGGHLRPGVKGAADTPEKKKRKGSFLTRHFTTPPGPVVKDGEPTRQALQAAAWGEPVPKTVADENKLAAKGRKLLAEAKKG